MTLAPRVRMLPRMTGISRPPADWPHRHLKQNELRWFDFDPSGLAEFVRRFGADDYPELPGRLMECRRAAWQCGSYLRFVADWPGRKLGDVSTAVVWNDADGPGFEEYGIDIDETGAPLGVELLHRECRDG